MTQKTGHIAALEAKRQLFAAELRHWRAVRRLSLRQLAVRTHDSHSLLGRIETAERLPSKELAERLDQALNADGAFVRIWGQIESALEAQADQVGVDPDLGLTWGRTPASTVTTVSHLWRADMDRRQLIVGAAWTAAAFLDPSRRWFADAIDPDTSHAGPRRIGSSEVQVMWSMARAFADADHHLGGGYARRTLMEFLDNTVAPILHGTYDTSTGRELLTAAARLTGLAAFMCFDSAHQGLAQRYYIQALRLAKAAGARDLGAHIFADMSMQAYELNKPRIAIAMAEPGQRAARDCGSPSTEARCSMLRARAHGLAGDSAAAAQAIGEAERYLARADLPDEPFWVQFFNEEQLAAELMYTAHDLGQSSQVQRHAPIVLKSAAGMQRREVLAATTLAASYLPGERGRDTQVDVDRACTILVDVLPSAAGLTSARGLASINAVRRRLADYSELPAVQQVEKDFREFAGATG